MEKQNIIGIDYSMSSPSICINSNDVFFITRNQVFEGDYTHGDFKFKGIWYGPIKSGHNKMQRFGHLTSIVLRELCDMKPGVAFLEGYSLGSKGNLTAIAENTGVLKVALAMKGWELRIVSPMTLKKEFGGKGNMKKPALADAWHDKFGFHVHDLVGCDKGDSPASDIIDSYAVMNCTTYETI